MGAARAVRNVTISIVVIVALIVGAGVAYTYYLGPDSSQNDTTAAEKAAEPAPSQAIKPSKPAPNATVSASVSVLTSPVTPGDNTSLTIKTVATSKCTIGVTYGTLAAKDSGLMPKIADEFGTVSWAWTVDKAAPLGTWPVKVTCAYNGKTAFVQGDLVVAKSTPPLQ